ncbi:PD-(D/E)XK nuclease family protein [Kribbella sp. NPDC003505]|uniref:PD-(D/E)XK nuclease family protein n=1 Tax=Kribbella sp. NPDC003505 TaxID=3154448 RepID=UPI00339E307F
MPPGMAGSLSLVRVQPSSARGNAAACPQFLAAKARPLVVARAPTVKATGLETFALSPVMDALDSIEYSGCTVEEALARLRPEGRGKALHPGLRTWVEHATRRFLEVSDRLTTAVGSALDPTRDEWIVRVETRESVVYEICAWGRRYVSADGTVRELRTLKHSGRGGDRTPASEVAVAAFVLAQGGTRSADPRRGVDRDGRVRRVRVVEVGCTDGTSTTLFDGSVEEAQALYDEHGRPQLREAVDGGEYRPGQDCVKCKLIEVCPVLPRGPGILGLASPRPGRATWSVSNGRTYETCPARDHLRRLNLPRDFAVEYGESAARGQAVHSWLEKRHRETPVRACRPSDVPEASTVLQIDRWCVEGSEAVLAHQMLGDHSVVCPLADVDPDTEPLLEETLVVYDEAANVIVLAKADLLYRSGGAWALRETKTTTEMGSNGLLWRYPQLALGLVLFAADVLPGSSRGRVELERLTPRGALLDVMAADDPALLAEARAVVRESVGAWGQDLTMPAKPGRHCRSCEVVRWCPERMATGEEASR